MFLLINIITSLDEFFCQPVGCINNIHKCDSIVDCFDEVDEKNCGNKTTTLRKEAERPLVRCGHDEFTCDNFECIPKYFRCDGKFYFFS